MKVDRIVAPYLALVICPGLAWSAERALFVLDVPVETQRTRLSRAEDLHGEFSEQVTAHQVLMRNSIRNRGHDYLGHSLKFPDEKVGFLRGAGRGFDLKKRGFVSQWWRDRIQGMKRRGWLDEGHPVAKNFPVLRAASEQHEADRKRVDTLYRLKGISRSMYLAPTSHPTSEHVRRVDHVAIVVNRIDEHGADKSEPIHVSLEELEQLYQDPARASRSPLAKVLRTVWQKELLANRPDNYRSRRDIHSAISVHEVTKDGLGKQIMSIPRPETVLARGNRHAPVLDTNQARALVADRWAQAGRSINGLPPRIPTLMPETPPVIVAQAEPKQGEPEQPPASAGTNGVVGVLSVLGRKNP